jgi:hypothetical protein
MRQDDLRLVGQYSKALLRLNPYRQSLTKRVGVFYAFAGAASAKAGTPLAVTPRALLTFIGTEPDWEHPTRTIEGMARAHSELFDIGLLATEPTLAPTHRTRGYFETWLDQPFSVYLSSALYANLDGPATLEALPPAIEPTRPRPPVDLAELRADPGRIRAFRLAHNLSLRELARVLKIAPMSLHRYEQGERTLPEPAATRLLSIWHERERRRDH